MMAPSLKGTNKSRLAVRLFRSRPVTSEPEIKEEVRLETEKEREHRESYEKHPVEPDEFYVDEEQLIEVWKDL